ncbi:MAG: Uma2 family endonuclease [Alphaproteobacteria bacterium]|nr:Uma2 family endonuclease [Alphaproteobacteria bacterium]
MAEPAFQRMDLAAFLRWDGDGDTRHELIAGEPVAMAPPSRAHGIVTARLCVVIGTALRARPQCTIQVEAGIAPPDRNDTCYIADLAVSCSPPGPQEQLIRDPELIVEILSPSTVSWDRQHKVADYRHIPSVREILLIDSQSIFAEVLRRDGERWITELVRGPGAVLSLASVPLAVALAELYEGLPIAAEAS